MQTMPNPPNALLSAVEKDARQQVGRPHIMSAVDANMRTCFYTVASSEPITVLNENLYPSYNGNKK